MREETSCALLEPIKITNPISRFLANAGKSEPLKVSSDAPIFLHWTLKVASDIIVPNIGVSNVNILLVNGLLYSMVTALAAKGLH